MRVRKHAPPEQSALFPVSIPRSRPKRVKLSPLFVSWPAARRNRRNCRPLCPERWRKRWNVQTGLWRRIVKLDICCPRAVMSMPCWKKCVPIHRNPVSRQTRWNTCSRPLNSTNPQKRRRKEPWKNGSVQFAVMFMKALCRRISNARSANSRRINL